MFKRYDNHIDYENYRDWLFNRRDKCFIKGTEEQDRYEEEDE